MTTTDVGTFLSALFDMTEAFSKDLAGGVDAAARRLRHTPKNGPIAICGSAANTRKHRTRKRDDDRSVHIVSTARQRESPGPQSGQQPMERAWTIIITPKNGSATAVDALAVAEDAFVLWQRFLRGVGLVT